MKARIPQPEVQDSDFGAWIDAVEASTPHLSRQVSIHWLGMPWFVTYKGPYIEQVNINGHWLNAAYVLGDALVRDLELVALREVAA